ncbi:MAG: helix-turn-helix domain-containing protein [Desulfurococcales archaeon]|nr:helix-turn-helix domain-containing protein [Desulfurococcales archaeon]MEB3779606.1 helix-turn-helix domain-containing protein [Desulfurococcales archaeon]
MPRTNRVKLVKLNVIQHGCPLADSSKDYKVYIEITSAALRDGDSIVLAWASEGDIRSMLKTLRGSSWIKRFHVLYRDDDSAWLYIVKVSSGILKTIHDAQGVLASPIIIDTGIKTFTVLIPSSNLNRLKRAAHVNLEARGYKVNISDATHILKSDSLLIKGIHVPFSMVKSDIISKLTPVEKRILVDMISEGYLEWPRKSSLEKIASKYGLSKSTVSYHIRSIEKKILGMLIEKYRLLDEWR